MLLVGRRHELLGVAIHLGLGLDLLVDAALAHDLELALALLGLVHQQVDVLGRLVLLGLLALLGALGALTAHGVDHLVVREHRRVLLERLLHQALGVLLASLGGRQARHLLRHRLLGLVVVVAKDAATSRKRRGSWFLLANVEAVLDAGLADQIHDCEREGERLRAIRELRGNQAKKQKQKAAAPEAEPYRWRSPEIASCCSLVAAASSLLLPLLLRRSRRVRTLTRLAAVLHHERRRAAAAAAR